MCNKQNLPSRVEKAKAALHFSKVNQYDANGKAKSVLIPGSNGKLYQVIIRRNRGISTELLLIVNSSQIKPHYAAQLTYHQMAAIMIAAQESGYNITWTANREDAKRLSNLGGKVFNVRNYDNPTNRMWGVMKKEK